VHSRAGRRWRFVVTDRRTRIDRTRQIGESVDVDWPDRHVTPVMGNLHAWLLNALPCLSTCGSATQQGEDRHPVHLQARDLTEHRGNRDRCPVLAGEVERRRSQGRPNIHDRRCTDAPEVPLPGIARWMMHHGYFRRALI